MRIPLLIASILASAPVVASDDAARSQVEYSLARSLVSRDLPIAASIYYARIVRRGPSDPFFAQALQGELAIADRVDDSALSVSIGPELLASLSPSICSRSLLSGPIQGRRCRPFAPSRSSTRTAPRKRKS
jgi:hypothetical protein